MKVKKERREGGGLRGLESRRRNAAEYRLSYARRVARSSPLLSSLSETRRLLLRAIALISITLLLRGDYAKQRPFRVAHLALSRRWLFLFSFLRLR